MFVDTSNPKQQLADKRSQSYYVKRARNFPIDPAEFS